MFYQYIGGGRYFHGLPARDLSIEEWNQIAQETQAMALAQGLYRLQQAPAPIQRSMTPQGDQAGEG